MGGCLGGAFGWGGVPGTSKQLAFWVRDVRKIKEEGYLCVSHGQRPTAGISALRVP